MQTRLLLISVLMALISACTGNSQAGSSSAQAGGSTQGDASKGEQFFVVTCSACHGVGGVGLAGLGKPLTTSEFVSQQSDEELLNFIKTGRPADDPLNTTGILMPPKGGNPALTDEEIKDIIAYIRSIRVKYVVVKNILNFPEAGFEVICQNYQAIPACRHASGKLVPVQHLVDYYRFRQSSY